MGWADTQSCVCCARRRAAVHGPGGAGPGHPRRALDPAAGPAAGDWLTALMLNKFEFLSRRLKDAWILELDLPHVGLPATARPPGCVLPPLKPVGCASAAAAAAQWPSRRGSGARRSRQSMPPAAAPDRHAFPTGRARRTPRPSCTAWAAPRAWAAAATPWCSSRLKRSRMWSSCDCGRCGSAATSSLACHGRVWPRRCC